MIKFLFFDSRGYELVQGFARQLRPPRKDEATRSSRRTAQRRHRLV